MPFFHPGSCTRIPYLHILETFLQIREMSGYQDAKNDNEIIIVF